MKKPYIVTWYSSSGYLEKKLNEIGAIFSKRDVLCNFWGVEFTITPFHGRGSYQKNRELEKLIYS